MLNFNLGEKFYYHKLSLNYYISENIQILVGIST